MQQTVAHDPAHHFDAFDVTASGTYLDFGTAVDLLECSGFPLVAKPIVRGSFCDCMDFDVESFTTTIPELLGLKGSSCARSSEDQARSGL